MAATLRDVLTTFEQADRPLTVGQMARDLDLAPAMLDSMIAYWVRKGKLRVVDDNPHCGACGHAQGCPFILPMPRRYELVTADDALRDDEPPSHAGPRCGCCG